MSTTCFPTAAGGCGAAAVTVEWLLGSEGLIKVRTPDLCFLKSVRYNLSEHSKSILGEISSLYPKEFFFFF